MKKETVLLLKGKIQLYTVYTDVFETKWQNILNMNRWGKYTKQMITKVEQVY